MLLLFKYALLRSSSPWDHLRSNQHHWPKPSRDLGRKLS